MKKTSLSLFTLLLLSIGMLNAQFSSNKDDKVHTKTKKEVANSRQVDLAQYKYYQSLMESAIKSINKQGVINSVKKIESIAATEIDRANNNLIDLYGNKQKTDETRALISGLEKRIKQMQQRYKVIINADFNGDPTSKQSAYVHSSINQFKKYMQQNYDEFDLGKTPTNKGGYTPAMAVKLDTSHNQMISSKTAAHKKSKPENPELKKFYDQQRLGISKVSKYSRELLTNLSSKDYGTANKVKENIIREMQVISANDDAMIKRIDSQEFEDLNLNPASLKRTYTSETKLIGEFKKLNIPKDNSAMMNIINEFNRLQRHL
jgi:hypothetical protein